MVKGEFVRWVRVCVCKDALVRYIVDDIIDATKCVTYAKL
jgi:hypothetical protein